MTSSTRPIVPFVALALLLVACTSGPGPSPTADGVALPGGSEVVVQVEQSGGFVPAEFVFSNAPHFTLLGDGRVIVAGAEMLIFPGPAVPNLQVRRLSEEGIDEVLAMLEASGAFSASAEYRGAMNFVADAADTIFTVNAGGESVRVTIHALGVLDLGGPRQGIAPEEIAAHRALGEVNERLMLLDEWLPADLWAEPTWRPYEPEAMRLLVRPIRPDEDHGVPPGELDWPLDISPATFGEETRLGIGRCGAVEGAEAQRMREALRDATQITQWLHDGTPYGVTVRPLLPSEEAACSDDLMG